MARHKHGLADIPTHWILTMGEFEEASIAWPVILWVFLTPVTVEIYFMIIRYVSPVCAFMRRLLKAMWYMLFPRIDLGAVAYKLIHFAFITATS